jgi:hypothetical protein
MQRKKSHNGKQSPVLIEDIANILPTNEWFTRVEFAEYTGIRELSSYQRLNTLELGGYIESKCDAGQELQYRMTSDMRLMMLERGRINKSNCGCMPKKKTERISKEKMAEYEIEAHRISAEMILKSIKFI